MTKCSTKPWRISRSNYNGGTPAHSLIGANSLGAIATRLSTARCRVYNSSLNVCVDRASLYVYPDVTVVCGKFQYADDRKYTVANPNLIIEVLSPTTLDYNLGPKARMYWKIASLTDLLFIDQEKVRIEYWLVHVECGGSAVRSLSPA